VVSGRLSRLEASGNVMVGSEQVLIEDWCQQYPSHSIGGLAFGADGALYVSGGDGASFNFVDYGQDGVPLNPCGDPPTGVGGTQTPPTAEGGALRSQDLQTSGDPVSLDGTILRVDPVTGAALPDNPLFNDSDPNAQRIIAYGLRNPFRITIRPGTNEVWIGDVGWSQWEEINRVLDPTDVIVENFGWPCYEGQNRQSGYDGANLTICEALYNTANAVTDPYIRYHHSDQVVPGESCPTGSSSAAGVAFEFYSGGAYPAEYDGALFFADYSRDCVWVSFQGADGLPNPSNIKTFIASAANPVDLKISPAGELFYADFNGGTIRRVEFVGTNQPPTAVAAANPTSGPAPLSVNFDGTGSSDPDPGDTLTYAWDLDGDGQFDDSTAAQLDYTYAQPGTYTAALHVTDSQGASDTDSVVITVNNTRPTAVATANPISGEAPLSVNFDGTGSSDPDPGDTLTYAWDLDGDGQFDDSTAAQPVFIYDLPGIYTAVLRVTDSQGASDTDSVVITVTGETPPTAVIETPGPGTTWQVDDVISFSGSATDAQDRPLPASALSWSLILHHCPDNCHIHSVQDFVGVAGGSFTAPDHEYPSFLELRLTATDSGGLEDTTSIQLDPQTVVLTFKTKPGNLDLIVGGTQESAAFDRTVIVGSRNTIIALSPQVRGKHTYFFGSWSDGGAQTHDIIAPVAPTSYVATFSSGANPPTVTITGPADGATFASGATISFAGSASDAEDGDVTTNLVWTSNIDGQIGTGGSFDTTLSDGSHTITATATDSTGASGSATISVAVGDLPTMHVGGLEGSSTSSGRGGKWNATVTITVHDSSHNSVSDATVNGSWSNGASGSASCPTVAGQCSVTKNNIKQNSGSVTFTVDSVSHASNSYDPGANHDPDGTSITVVKP
jgi:PKD repeat protein